MVVAGSDKKRKEGTPRLLRIASIIALVLYGGLFGLAFVPFVGMLVYIYAFFVAYLWAYIGLAAAGVAFVVAWSIGYRLLTSSRERLKFGSLAAAIAFVTVGIALILSIRFFRYDAHLIGFRLHTRIWLDANEVRRWAQGLDMAEAHTGRQIFHQPMTLRLTGLPAGRVSVDPQTRDVTLEQGSPLSGHWGVFVTADGGEWEGEHPFLDVMDRLKVEDGVWVWYTED